jgi:hypothetical protein
VLRARLGSSPWEFELLFRHPVNLNDLVYQEWTYKALKIVQATRELGIFIFNMALDRLDIAIFYFAINGSIGPEGAQNIIPDELHPYYYNAAVSLAARCAGILEAS